MTNLSGRALLSMYKMNKHNGLEDQLLLSYPLLPSTIVFKKFAQPMLTHSYTLKTTHSRVAHNLYSTFPAN